MSKHIALFLLGILWLFQCSTIGLERSQPNKTVEIKHLQSLIKDQNLYLWNLSKTPIDESGFMSLQKDDRFVITKVDLKKDISTGSVFIITFNDRYEYVLQNDFSCDAVNQAYTFFLNRLEDQHVLCVSHYTEGYPRMLVIGKNNNEQVKKYKENKKYYSVMPNPIIKKYTVKTDQL